jgi:tetratricopeptide (TPR) repeat protein
LRNDTEYFTHEHLGSLLDECVAEILAHEDPDRFLSWFKAQAPRLIGHMPIDPAGLPALAAALGRGIWNSIPLPGHHFQPKPLPAPGRNDPCPCGSGRKFKQCCAGAPQFPPFHAEDVWPIVIDHLSAAALESAVAHKRIPQGALAAAAERLIDAGEPRRAAKLLEPLFEGHLERLDERYEPAFDTLCDAYLELGFESKRRDLVERVATGAKSALSRAAYERMATMLMDEGRSDEAWEAFRSAQRAEPGFPSLALCEVMLLIVERRYDEAAARARYWASALARSDWEADDVIDQLERIAEDPAGALADTFLERSGIDIEPLRAWVDACHERALPAYAFAPSEPVDLADEKQVRAHLGSMGVPADRLDAAVAQFMESLPELQEEAQRDNPEPADDQPIHVLGVPASIEALEARWHEVFPAPKPISTQPYPVAGENVWAPETAHAWLAFLREHPESYDSLDILDDLACALGQADESMLPGVENEVLSAIVERGAAIVLSATSGVDTPLPWIAPQNRPALRLLAMRIDQLLDEDDEEAAARLMARVLQLNPNDNHGFRSILMNYRMRTGDLQAALSLSRNYPHDTMVELRYGEALACYKLGELAQASAALAEAIDANRYVPEYLANERATQPKLSPYGVAPGGRDEAWLYAQEAGDLWRADPAVLSWLKASKGVKKR